MKKISLLIGVVLLTTIVMAQNADKKWAVGLGGGYYQNLSVKSANGLAGEIYFSRYLSPSFDIRLKPSFGFFLDGGGSDHANILLEARYKFYNGKILPVDTKIQPYLFAGSGYLSDNGGPAGLNFDAGLGAKCLIKPNFAIYAEAGYVNGVKTVVRGDDRHDDFVKAIVGIEIAFGPRKDADKDGVVDSKDLCPNTPKGAKVDKNGCPIDSDNDGVYDGIDLCPNEKGILANNGCPLDEKKVTWLKNVKVKSIFFETSSSDLSTESTTRLDELVKIMLDNPSYHVNAYGFADPRGDAEANRQLSARRANAAVQYLISKRVSPSKISTQALGEEHSNTANLSEEELQNSRRVDFNLYK